jgi:hypothetical protein
MTKKEKVKQLVKSSGKGKGKDDVCDLIRLAYWMGMEDKAKTMCDNYAKRLRKMRKRADSVRYKNMANSVIDAGVESDKNGYGVDIMYDPDYSADYSATFGI